MESLSPGAGETRRGVLVPQQCHLRCIVMGRTYHQFYLVHDTKCKEQEFWRLCQPEDAVVTQLHFLGAGWYYLVSPVLFLRDGRKQTRKWRQFMDTPYGVHHPGGQYVGDRIGRMESRLQTDKDSYCNRDRYHHSFCFAGWKR